jgi:predicted NAD/FAD-dependent oxidoreductase
MDQQPRRIAIIGGGITGAIAASHLGGSTSASVTLFDQGRRGPGGRASHRAVDESTWNVLPDDPPIPASAIEFDHGCQFFRADHPRMKALADEWCEQGWAAEWNGRFGFGGGAKDSAAIDFFGLPGDTSPVYAGVGGMHLLPRRLLGASSSNVKVCRGVRVAGMHREEDGKWALLGVDGEAAYHDTSDAEALQAQEHVLGTFDTVLLTDVSSSFGGWHRASAGVPEAFAARVRDRVRIPLFACMVAFSQPLGLPLDGVTGPGAPSGLWFAARTQSKPGLAGDGASNENSSSSSSSGSSSNSGLRECWTLISTPQFAVDELGAEPMQDAATGAFKPQEDSYLNTGPAPALLEAFAQAVAHLRPPVAVTPPEESNSVGSEGTVTQLLGPDGAQGPDLPHLKDLVVYMQGQRWGSAMPAPSSVGGRDSLGRSASTVTLMGVEYETATPSLVYARPEATEADVIGEEGGGVPAEDFIADDRLGLCYAGDFTSRRAPGFEAAALSGLAAAEHIASLIGSSSGPQD